MVTNNTPKVLFVDLETSPNAGYIWGKYKQNVLSYINEWEILCFCYKWQGEDKIHSVSAFKDGGEGEVVVKLWRLFDEADIIIAHNGDAFDIKKSNAKFIEYGLTPPSSYQTIDTLKVARKYFKFNSNKLGDIAKLLGLELKMSTGGFELWLGCMADDKDSWNKMVEYCKQDIVVLEAVYMELRPWMRNAPNMNLFTGRSHGCPVCGSEHTQRRGVSRTRIGERQRYQCQACSAWSVGELIKTNIVVR